VNEEALAHGGTVATKKKIEKLYFDTKMHRMNNFKIYLPYLMASCICFLKYYR